MLCTFRELVNQKPEQDPTQSCGDTHLLVFQHGFGDVVVLVSATCKVERAGKKDLALTDLQRDDQLSLTGQPVVLIKAPPDPVAEAARRGLESRE